MRIIHNNKHAQAISRIKWQQKRKLVARRSQPRKSNSVTKDVTRHPSYFLNNSRQLYLSPVAKYSMLKFKCRDVGFDCGFTAKAKTEDEIMQKCAIHAQEDHGMKPEDITDDLKNKIRANTHKSFF